MPNTVSLHSHHQARARPCLLSAVSHLTQPGSIRSAQGVCLLGVRHLVQISPSPLWADRLFFFSLSRPSGKKSFLRRSGSICQVLFSTFPLYENRRVMDSAGGPGQTRSGQGFALAVLVVCMCVHVRTCWPIFTSLLQKAKTWSSGKD